MDHTNLVSGVLLVYLDDVDEFLEHTITMT